jgi:hypothetical protein
MSVNILPFVAMGRWLTRIKLKILRQGDYSGPNIITRALISIPKSKTRCQGFSERRGLSFSNRQLLFEQPGRTKE